jgi:hypothetical protein
MLGLTSIYQQHTRDKSFRHQFGTTAAKVLITLLEVHLPPHTCICYMISRGLKMSPPGSSQPLFDMPRRIPNCTHARGNICELFLLSNWGFLMNQSVCSFRQDQRRDGYFALRTETPISSAEREETQISSSGPSLIQKILNLSVVPGLLNRILSLVAALRLKDAEIDSPLLSFESAYLHNCTNSAFYRLPLELIIEIAQHSSPTTRLIMQQICMKFRSGLKHHGMTPNLENANEITVKEMFQFAFLLQHDLQQSLQNDYNKKCNLLMGFGCSGCRTTHEKEHFSIRQLSLPANERICHGLEASFRLCDNLTFSGECLLRGLRQLQNAEIYCQVGHRNDIYGNYMACFGVPTSGPRVGFHGGHTITMDQTIPLLLLQKDEKVTHDQLSTAVRKRYIFPSL